MAVNLTRFFLQLLALWVLTTGLLACQADSQKLAETSRHPSARPPSDSSILAQKATATPTDSVSDQRVVTAYPYSIPPVDDTKRDPALRAFVQKVIGYAKKRQLKQLLAVADDSIAVSYGGGDYGKQAFKEYLNNSHWNGYAEIRRALEMGGAIDSIGSRVLYNFPYLQSQDLLSKQLRTDIDAIDLYATCIGLTDHTELYEKPDKTSRLLASLAYPILSDDSIDGRPQKAGWRKLKTVDNRIHGYVNDSDVYSAVDRTIVIEKKQGLYKLLSISIND